MPKSTHQFRDPIHNFITVEDRDRKLIDSNEIQRLRHIHQLAMTYLVYPGATHRRFEHSLGVMHLADQAFQTLVDTADGPVREFIPQLSAPQDTLAWWERTIRIAALLHDIGHLPFSHAAEQLTRSDWDHETFTAQHIATSNLSSILGSEQPNLEPRRVAKLAVSDDAYQTVFPDDKVTNNWEALLREIITGDGLGVDRIDYLLRDSHHAGVAYGKFDHHRLMNSIRFLLYTEEKGDVPSTSPELGVTEGGLHAAEALLLARYFMFTQVYFHPVRVAYDIHLADFLSQYLETGLYSTDAGNHLSITDAEITVALRNAAKDPLLPGHVHANRIVQRRHFKKLRTINKDDLQINSSAGQVLHKALAEHFGVEQVKRNAYNKNKQTDMPVLRSDGQVVPASSMSEVFRQTPQPNYDYIFVDNALRVQAAKWLEANRIRILENSTPEESR